MVVMRCMQRWCYMSTRFGSCPQEGEWPVAGDSKMLVVVAVPARWRAIHRHPFAR